MASGIKNCLPILYSDLYISEFESIEVDFVHQKLRVDEIKYQSSAEVNVID